MDIATPIGMLGAMGLIVAAMAQSAGVGAFIDVPSVLIVVCGTAMAVLCRSTLPEFLGSFGVFLKAILPGAPKEEVLIERLGEFSAMARKDGMMALEGQETPDPFFGKGVQMLVDGADEASLKTRLTAEIGAMKSRHASGLAVWQAWMDIAPAMGMIGTLVGLVAMLGAMDDPKAIGPAMAVALLTTLYGAMIANVIALPIIDKLKGYDARECKYRELVLLGLIGIARNESSRNIQDKLAAFLAPKLQAKIEAAG